jgi:hypothetical protein
LNARRDRRPGDKSAHAVHDQRDLRGGVARNAFGQLLAQHVEAAPPVVGVIVDVKARDLQPQLELQVADRQHAQRHDAVARAQRQLHQSSAGDVDRIEPDDVVGQDSRALFSEPRAGDARQQQHAWSAATAFGFGLGRQRAELFVVLLAEQLFVLRAMLGVAQLSLERLFVHYDRRERFRSAVSLAARRGGSWCTSFALGHLVISCWMRVRGCRVLISAPIRMPYEARPHPLERRCALNKHEHKNCRRPTSILRGSNRESARMRHRQDSRADSGLQTIRAGRRADK